MSTRLMLVLPLSGVLALYGQATRSWTVEGTVINSATHAPIPGAAVRATYCPARITEVITDASGHYKLQGDKPGACQIYPFKEGYVPDYQMMKPRHLTIPTGGQLKGIDIQLAPDAVIAGHVLDAEKNPVRGAYVSLLRRAWSNGALGMERVGGADVNDLGEYRIASVAEGRFYLQVGIGHPENSGPLPPPPAKGPDRRPPPLARPVFYPNALDLDGAAPIRVNPGDRLESIDFSVPRLNRTSCVSGTVAGSVGGPAASIRVGLTRILPLRYDAGIADGRFSPGKDFVFCGIAPGTYHVTLIEPSGNKVLGLSQSTIVVSDRDVSLGKLSAAPSHILKGKAVMANAAPDDAFPSGVSIQVFPNGRGSSIEDLVAGTVPPSGDFVIPAVFEGDFRLSVNGLPAGYYVGEASQDAHDVGTGRVLIPGGDLRIVLGSDGPRLSGQVVDKDGQPVSDAAVVLKNSGTDQITSRSTDQDGRFMIDSRIAPGDYALLAFTGIRASEAEDPAAFSANSSTAMKLTLTPKQDKSVSITAVAWAR